MDATSTPSQEQAKKQTEDTLRGLIERGVLKGPYVPYSNAPWLEILKLADESPPGDGPPLQL